MKGKQDPGAEDSDVWELAEDVVDPSGEGHVRDCLRQFGWHDAPWVQGEGGWIEALELRLLGKALSNCGRAEN